jgi:hypothetical protein
MNATRMCIMVFTLPMSLREESILNLSEFHGCGAFCIVIHNAVDPSANRIAPHQPSVVGLQQIGSRVHIVHGGVQPQVVGIQIENHWHPVVNARGHDWPKTFTLVAIPRQPILSFVAQHVATVGEKTLSGHRVAARFRLQERLGGPTASVKIAK